MAKLLDFLYAVFQRFLCALGAHDLDFGGALPGQYVRFDSASERTPVSQRTTKKHLTDADRKALEAAEARRARRAERRRVSGVNTE